MKKVTKLKVKGVHVIDHPRWEHLAHCEKMDTLFQALYSALEADLSSLSWPGDSQERLEEVFNQLETLVDMADLDIYPAFTDCPKCEKNTLRPLKSVPPKVKCPRCEFEALEGNSED